MKYFFSIVAAAGIALAAEGATGVELIAPRAGAVLEGGRETVIEWSAGSLPKHAEEWEAFLSLDGGGYYAVRITPHLNAGIRSFTWRVPNVAAAQARILIRVGDEREERAIEFPQNFRIVPGAVSVVPGVLAVITTEGRGESALPAAPPIVEWVSGDRSGGGLVTQHHRDRSAVSGEHVRIDDDGIVNAFAPSRYSLNPPGSASTANAGSTPEVRAARSLRKPRPVLLLVTRLNI
jgi:hypothetical protein